MVPPERISDLRIDASGVVSTWLPVIVYGPSSLLVHAFHSGCTDYLKDPWEPAEFYVRLVKATSERFYLFRWGEISFFPFYAVLKGQIEALTPQEYLLLFVLRRCVGRAVSRKTLSYALWGEERMETRAIDMHISQLRRKLSRLVEGKETSPRYTICTVHGQGYLLLPAASAADRFNAGAAL